MSGRDSGTESATAIAPAVARGWISRLKLGHVVMVLAALFALVLNLAVLSSNDTTVEIYVAAVEIQPGALLAPGQLATVEAAADDVLLSQFVRAADADDVVGSIVTRHLAEGQPVMWADLREGVSEDGLRAMSIPVDPSRAVDGDLAAGDSVDVVWVSEGVAAFIAVGVEVLGVPRAENNALGARSGYAPTVAVDDRQALQIVAALDSGEVHLVRSTGASTPEIGELSATGIPPEDTADE